MHQPPPIQLINLKKRIHRRWDELADWWVGQIGKEDDLVRSRSFLPQIRAVLMLDHRSPAKVLDAGCGEGGFSRWLGERCSDVLASESFLP